MACRFLISAAFSIAIVSPALALEPSPAAPSTAAPNPAAPSSVAPSSVSASDASPVIAGRDTAPAQTPPAVATARNSAIAVINADNTYVRSGAGENYYPTAKLDKGTQVTVVGAKFGWLKIVPPPGSFSCVIKSLVDPSPDGSTGTINHDQVNIRAGSEINGVKTSVQGQLDNGQKVKILGDVDEYYKIAPPENAYLYVKKEAVDLVKAIPGGTQSEQSVAKRATGDDGAVTTPDAIAGAGDAGAAAAVPGATTQPASTAQADFDKAEADFKTASAQPIEKQPLAELSATYTKLLADPALPDSMKRIADFRVQTIKVRVNAKNDLLAVQKDQADAKQKEASMKAEQQELAQQIKKTDVKVFTAVGTLRTSSLQVGGQMLYRLTDPATGRTVCYLRSDDPKYGGMLGQFIGVKGALTTDAQLALKVVAPTEVASVDPNQLYRSIAAEVVPPSLLPQAAQQASATGQ